MSQALNKHSAEQNPLLILASETPVTQSSPPSHTDTTEQDSGSSRDGGLNAGSAIY